MEVSLLATDCTDILTLNAKFTTAEKKDYTKHIKTNRNTNVLVMVKKKHAKKHKTVTEINLCLET